MSRLLERNIASLDDRLVLVAPPKTAIPECFSNVIGDSDRHGGFVRDVQRLRGSVYLEDGAVRPEQLTPDGLHQTPEDTKSWHLLMLNGRGSVSGCAWYMEHDDSARFEQLRVRHCPLSNVDEWRGTLRRSIESELNRARRDGLRFVEVGGWAVAPDSRSTSEGLVLALTAYSLGRTLGGALGLTTATVRHSSSTILKRLGGSPLEFGGVAVPPYYDSKYECEMEVLRFDSRTPSAKYASLIDMVGRKLTDVAVVADSASTADAYAPRVTVGATTCGAAA